MKTITTVAIVGVSGYAIKTGEKKGGDPSERKEIFSLDSRAVSDAKSTNENKYVRVHAQRDENGRAVYTLGLIKNTRRFIIND